MKKDYKRVAVTEFVSNVSGTVPSDNWVTTFVWRPCNGVKVPPLVATALNGDAHASVELRNWLLEQLKSACGAVELSLDSGWLNPEIGLALLPISWGNVGGTSDVDPSGSAKISINNDSQKCAYTLVLSNERKPASTNGTDPSRIAVQGFVNVRCVVVSCDDSSLVLTSIAGSATRLSLSRPPLQLEQSQIEQLLSAFTSSIFSTQVDDVGGEARTQLPSGLRLTLGQGNNLTISTRLAVNDGNKKIEGYCSRILKHRRYGWSKDADPPQLKKLSESALATLGHDSVVLVVLRSDPASNMGHRTLASVAPSILAITSPANVATDDRVKVNPSINGLVKKKSDRELFRVTRSRLLEPDCTADDEDSAVAVDPEQNLALASNAYSALAAFEHTSRLFSSIDAAGLSIKQVFRFVQLPVLVRYRAAICYGAKGKDDVNAQVAIISRGKTGKHADPRPQVEVRFGRGHKTAGVRSAETYPPLPSLGDEAPMLIPSIKGRVEPIGAAADVRWCWHEYGHVLLAAATGHLELPFCHSIGDALAAIACDPDSKLNGDDRGLTFPWLHVPRRHDRQAKDGWGWDGAMHSRALYTIVEPTDAPKSYGGEQILASTLFTLYLSLVNTDDSSQPRADASKLVINLVLTALALAGSADMTPVRTPTQFAALLLDADLLRGTNQSLSILAAFRQHGLAI
jgi:hypothetical protein